MSTTENPKDHPTGNAEKNPDDWTTGDEAMTGAQASYLKTLSEEAGETFDDTLTAGSDRARKVTRRLLRVARQSATARHRISARRLSSRP
jgi:hypothetical protein